ncbi:MULTISPECIES: cytochrome P450 family protein [Streptomyces]|uniref:Cytochrome P450 n=2 Tax=Streptomyces TaxID=1883 RepID=A0A7H1QCW2_9ACTN|nr:MULTISPECIES: cytochrome P450 [Streptomyces]MBA9050680.1 cytochrome P450 [Streptomyces murinus]QNT98142.1 cytochrome P450 [Streptomyces griseofuscus]BAC76495.1 P450 hydroxylase LkmK [Streptomyces rochei]
MNQPQLPEIPALNSELFHTDQYATYREILEQRPVTRVRFYDGSLVWLVNRHEDVRAALTDPRLSNDPMKQSDIDLSAATGIPADLIEYFQRNMFRSDEPDHGRLRKLVTREFTVRRINALRPRIRQIADDLLEKFAATGGGDLVEALARPLPLTVMCELLGVPEEDRADFQTWSQHIVESSPEFAERNAVSYRSLFECVRSLIRRRRDEPGDDLLSALVDLRDVADRLSENELISTVFLLLVAGIETTVNVLGTGTFLLLTHPGELARLRADGALLGPAVEEMLRYMAPIEITSRHTLEPVEIGGVSIDAQSTVLINLAAANRDPARFEDPQSFRVDRNDGGHLTFGHGIHYCLGAALARAEAEVTFEALLERFPDLRLAASASDLTWRHAFMRGPVELPVSWG